MMSDLIFVLSDQNGDLVGHMYIQEKNICSPALNSVVIMVMSIESKDVQVMLNLS